MNATTCDIDNALAWMDMADMVCKLSERVTFGGGDPTKAGHTMLVDLVEFIID